MHIKGAGKSSTCGSPGKRNGWCRKSSPTGAPKNGVNGFKPARSSFHRRAEAILAPPGRLVRVNSNNPSPRFVAMFLHRLMASSR